jgi:hypothetical protein
LLGLIYWGYVALLGGKLVLVPILLMVRKETLNATKSINLLT